MSGYDEGHEWPPAPAPVPAPAPAPAPAQPPPVQDTWWQGPPPPSLTPPVVARSGGPGPVVAAATAVFVLLALAVAGLLVWVAVQRPVLSASAAGPADQGGTTDGSTAAAPVAARVDPAVVTIDSTFGYRRAGGAGSGIVISADGEVLTNNHVIDGATAIQATDQGNGRTYSATVVGYDRSHDLALLRLTGASGLRTADLGDSSRLTVGQAVVAVGNAGGTGTAVSAAGSITALSQDITASDDLTGTSERLSGLIEVDADVQPGDSGGPLADASGRVIGVDTAASAGMRFQGGGGQGYAVPINQALATVRRIESGQASATVHIGPTAFLGVLLATGTADDPDRDGAGVPAPATGGATIAGVVSGGTADRAGLVGGDTITGVNGAAVDSAATLSEDIAALRPGDQVRLAWVDASGIGHSASVPLGSGPPA